jgi:nicotinate-nucleotide pyrophosphorylase (carboxylating)
VKMIDTRKTTPGMRELEKYAVRTGGGSNHRSGLHDAILIKDNHIKLVGLENAVSKAKETGKEVEVEACTIEEVSLALKAGADIIMLDNMSTEEIEKAVGIIGKHAVVEVSGGVNEGNIEGIAKLGVDWISVGRLTHSVPSVEISMEMVGVCPETS